MDKQQIKLADREIYNSAEGIDFIHSSWSSKTMLDFELLWLADNSHSTHDDKSAIVGIDIGCGNGETIPWVAGRSNFVIGLDHSITVLKHAKTKFDNPGDIPLINGDAELLPFKPDSIDYIFCGSILHHLPDHKSSLTSIYCCLREGGIVVATEPCAFNPFAVIRRRFFPSNIHTPDEHPFPPGKLIKDFKRIFDIVLYRRNYIFSINAGIIEKILGKKAAYIYLKCFMLFDSILLKIPLINSLCWRLSIIGIKKKNINN
jgi:SAM-dependent methyltransferase